MEPIPENDCNATEPSRLLVGSIQILLDLNQWNNFVKLQAIDDPFRFIEEVAKHKDDIVKEDEQKGSHHMVITGLTATGRSNKIGAIKLIRQWMGWGLGDSKMAYEKLPGSGNPTEDRNYSILLGKQYGDMNECTNSQEWKEHKDSGLFFVEVKRYPWNTPASSP
jgi:hypothetical protein